MKFNYPHNTRDTVLDTELVGSYPKFLRHSQLLRGEMQWIKHKMPNFLKPIIQQFNQLIKMPIFWILFPPKQQLSINPIISNFKT